MADGFWVVHTKPGSSSKSCVAKLHEIPSDTYDFSRIMINVEDLSTFIVDYKDQAAKDTGFYPSAYELSKAILKFLANKAGLKGSYIKPEEPERKIDLTL